jgi:hypothetical protein
MIKLNQKAKQSRINTEFKGALAKIKANAKKGVAITELIIDREIYSDVREKIDALVKGNKIDGFWLTMSGPVGMQNSIAYGDNCRLMKFKIRD